MAYNYVPPPLILTRGAGRGNAGPVNNNIPSSPPQQPNSPPGIAAQHYAALAALPSPPQSPATAATPATVTLVGSSPNVAPQRSSMLPPAAVSSPATPLSSLSSQSLAPRPGVATPVRSGSVDAIRPTARQQYESVYMPPAISSSSSSIGGAGVLVRPRSSTVADVGVSMPAAVMDDYFGPNTESERVAEQTRQKRCTAFMKMSVSNKRSYLLKEVKAHEQRIDSYRQLLVTSETKRKNDKLALESSMDKLRRWMMIPKVNVLQQCAHLQQLLTDNQDQMCQASIIVLKERLATIHSVLDDLGSGSSDVRLEPSFFRSAREASNNHAQLIPLLKERAELERQLHAAKVEYIRISRITEAEEKLDRPTRIARVLDDFINFFKDAGAGATPMGNTVTVTHYKPARNIEYEFSRFLLDERCREGLSLNKWYERLEKAPPADPSTILTTLNRFIGGFRLEYKIPAERLVFLQLLIQRILFPRLWKICIAREPADVSERDKKFRAQVAWMRNLTQRQLGIPDAYCLDLEEEKERDAIASVIAAKKKAAAELAAKEAKAKRAAALAAASSTPPPEQLQQQSSSPATTNNSNNKPPVAAAVTSEFDFITMTTAQPIPVGGHGSKPQRSQTALSSSSGDNDPSPEVSPVGSASHGNNINNNHPNGLSAYTPPGTGPGSNPATRLTLTTNTSTGSSSSSSSTASGRLPSTSPPLNIEPRRRLFPPPAIVSSSTPPLESMARNISGGGGATTASTSGFDSPLGPSSGATTPTAAGSRSGPSSSPPSPGTAAFGVLNGVNSHTTVITSTSEDDMSVLLSSFAPSASSSTTGTPADTSPLLLNDTLTNTNGLLHRRSQSDNRLSDRVNHGHGHGHAAGVSSHATSSTVRARGLSDAHNTSFEFEELDHHGEARGPIRADDQPTVTTGFVLPQLSSPAVPPSPNGDTASNASGSGGNGSSGPSTPIVGSAATRRFGNGSGANETKNASASSGLHDALTANKPAAKSTPSKPRGPRPFKPCIDILEDFSQLSVPLDMMQCILCCAQSVYRTARDNAAKKDSKMKDCEIGADNFFPILLYAIIHAPLYDVHRRLRLLSIFCGNETMSERSYYLTCFEGAVSHILNATPDEF